jgi:hypothetical protein
MKIVLSSTVTNRPQYLQRVIEGYRAVRGIENLVYQPNLEPVSEECKKMVYAIDFMEIIPYINSRVLGPGANTYRALSRAFERSDFVIHSEDDHLWAPDTLEYILWAKDKYQGDKSVFDIGCWATYQHPTHDTTKTPSENFHNVIRRPHYCPAGWATWIDRWEEPNGMASHVDFPDHRGYDFEIQDIRGDRDEIYPIVSRIQNIGLIGVHADNSSFFHQEITNKIWAGDPKIFNTQDWKEVSWLK